MNVKQTLIRCSLKPLNSSSGTRSWALALHLERVLLSLELVVKAVAVEQRLDLNLELQDRQMNVSMPVNGKKR